MNIDKIKFLEDHQATIASIKKAFYEIFPNSYITINVAPLGGPSELVITCYLQKPDEWANGIYLNDPLSYSVFYNPVTGLWHENNHYLTIKATNPYMAYDSVKFRKQIIKQANYTKIKARFSKLKQFVVDNAHLMAHDITGKI